MKILLTVTPSGNTVTLEHDDSISRGIGLYPPLGLMYLASYLNENSDHSLYILDSEAEKLSFEKIEERIKDIRPDIVGITAFTNTLKTLVEVLRVIKKCLPECITVLGGPHVELYPRETMEIKEVDYAIAGDGEKAFYELLTVLNADNGDLLEDKMKNIAGLLFRDSAGRIIQNGTARISDLNSLPFPDRTLIKQNPYYCILGKGKRMGTMISSRGCPFKCSFCNSPDKNYRSRSAINIVDEMESLADMKIHEIFFFDDLFNFRKETVLEICDEIIKRDLHKRVKWAFRGRVNTLVDEELVRKLREAGCQRIQLGIEKATDESLRKIKKGSTVQMIIKAVDLLSRYDILSIGNFILFTPEEDEQDVERIIAFSLKLKLDHVEYHVFAPYPGSEIYEEGLRTKIFDLDFWADFVKNPYDLSIPVWEGLVSRRRKMSIINNAYKRFYFRPRIIFNELRRLSSWAELKTKFKGALTVLRLGK